MTYLVLRFQSLGNVSMTVPVLESASRLQPEDTFVIVAKKRLNALFHGLENVKFHEVDFGDGSIKSLLRVYHELRQYHIDHVIDLQRVPRSLILRWLFRLRGVKNTVVRYGRVEKRILALFGARHDKVLPTEFERYAATFEAAGLKTDTRFTALPVNEQAAANIQTRFGKKTGRRIGFAPFARSRSNMLPYRTIKGLLAALSRQADTEVFLFGAGKIESELLRQWSGLYTNVISVAEQLPLEEELELMRTLDVMVCMDSANQHLASLVGLRAVSIWCGTHPKMGFYGWKQRPEDCIAVENLMCRPCTVHGTNICRYRNYACRTITVEQILDKI